jgi:hypothetical protein
MIQIGMPKCATSFIQVSKTGKKGKLSGKKKTYEGKERKTEWQKLELHSPLLSNSVLVHQIYVEMLSIDFMCL